MEISLWKWTDLYFIFVVVHQYLIGLLWRLHESGSKYDCEISGIHPIRCLSASDTGQVLHQIAQRFPMIPVLGVVLGDVHDAEESLNGEQAALPVTLMDSTSTDYVGIKIC